MNDNEKQVLSILLHSKSAYWKSKLQDSYFSTTDGQQIYGAIRQCYADGIEPEPIVLVQKYGVQASTIAELHGLYIGESNFIHHHNEVKEASRRRKLKQLSVDIQTLLNPSVTALEVVNEIDARLQAIVSDSEMVEIVKLGSTTKAFIEELEDKYKRNGGVGEIDGLSTGFETVDDCILGLRKKRLHYIAARPSEGKSALAINMIAHLAKHHTVGIIDLESDRSEKMQRLVALNAKINSMKLAMGQLTKSDFHSLMKSLESIYDANIYTYDKPALKLSELKTIARRMVQFNKCDIIFIDYWQLIVHDNRKLPLYEQLSDISRQLKDLARVLDIPIVVLAQLNRQNEQHRSGSVQTDDGQWIPKHWAQPSELKGSGAAEQDADVLVFINHAYNDKMQILASYLQIAKARDGVKKIVPVQFTPQYLQFQEL